MNSKRKKVVIVERKLGRERFQGNRVVGLWYKNNEIAIDPRQAPKDFLDTLIHELLHVVRPELSEEATDETAGFLTKELWKMKYRRTKTGK